MRIKSKTVMDQMNAEKPDDVLADLEAKHGSSAPPCSAKWLIWSNEHRAWWRPNSAGYTTYSKAAGRYDYEEAVEICMSARSHGPAGTPPPETMIREDCISPNKQITD